MAVKNKKIVSLDQQNNRVKIAAFELENPVVFEFFNKRVSGEEYDDVLLRALYIGILAQLNSSCPKWKKWVNLD